MTAKIMIPEGSSILCPSCGTLFAKTLKDIHYGHAVDAARDFVWTDKKPRTECPSCQKKFVKFQTYSGGLKVAFYTDKGWVPGDFDRPTKKNNKN